MKKAIYLIAAAAILSAAATAQAKDHMKKNWLDKETADITEDYDDAIKEINESSFTEEQKTILRAQAQANKELALSQAKAADAQMQKNREARKGFFNSDNSQTENKKHGKHGKKARKVFEEIDDIL